MTHELTTTPCFECGQPAAHEHHVVPASCGGTKTVPLCETCHGKIHGLGFQNHRELVKLGIQRARENGIRIGNQIVLSPEKCREVVRLRSEGLSVRQIARKVGLSVGSVHKLISA